MKKFVYVLAAALSVSFCACTNNTEKACEAEAATPVEEVTEVVNAEVVEPVAEATEEVAEATESAVEDAAAKVEEGAAPAEEAK